MPQSDKKVYLDEQGNPIPAPAKEPITTFVEGVGFVPIENQPSFGEQPQSNLEDLTASSVKLRRFFEDIAMPGVGAAIGAGAGLPAGPIGAGLGAVIGAMGGEAYKQLERQVFDPNVAPKTSEEALQNISTAGIGGALQEIGGIRRAAGILPKGLPKAQQIIKTAQEYNVPMSAGQRRQGVLGIMEEIIKRSLGAGKIFREKLEEPQNLALQDAVATIAKRASTTGSQETLGTVVQDSIQGAYKQAGVLYDEALNTISKAGTSNVPLNLRPLQDKAIKLMNEIKLSEGFGEKALGTVESRKLALGILDDFVNPKEGLALTFEQARRRRTQLRALIESGDMTIGKGALSQLRQSLDTEMKQALVVSGRADLARLFTTASQNYAKTIDLMDTNIIKGLIKAQQPEEIGKYLLARGKQTAITNLHSLIGEVPMRDVQAGLWKELFHSSMKGGFTDSRRFANAWSSLDDSTKTALWPNPVLRAKMDKFVQLVKTIGLRPEETGQTLLSFGQFQRISAAAGQIVGVGAALSGVGSTGQQDFGDWAIRLGEAGAMSLAPMTLAKIITRPGGIDVVNKALTTRAGTKAAKELGWKLLTLIVAEEFKEHHGQNQ